MSFFSALLDLFRNLGNDDKWKVMIDHLGGPNALYALLFAIIFAETGLVVTPFLPGDSLLFGLGAVGVRNIGINLPLITVLLIIAAVIGDTVNYYIGFKLGPKVFNREEKAPGERGLKDKLLNKKHLLRAQEFYERYGGKTIILARFVPVVRTFAPFVAGVGKMNYFRFAMYNVIGAILWVGLCVGAGMWFGQYKVVQERFELVILMIVFISLLPMIIEFIRAKRASKAGGSAIVEVATIGESEPTSIK